MYYFLICFSERDILIQKLRIVIKGKGDIKFWCHGTTMGYNECVFEGYIFLPILETIAADKRYAFYTDHWQMFLRNLIDNLCP